jgi:hypothetical protein
MIAKARNHSNCGSAVPSVRVNARINNQRGSPELADRAERRPTIFHTLAFDDSDGAQTCHLCDNAGFGHHIDDLIDGLVPHERLALVELGFIVIFFENQWSGWKFFRKCALLLHWWPVIAAKIRSKRTKPGSFWHIPSNWPEKGKLKAVSNQDPKLLQIEAQRAKGKRAKKSAKPSAQPGTSYGPLFEYADKKTKGIA